MIHKKAVEDLDHIPGDFYVVSKQGKENQGIKGKGYKGSPSVSACVWAVEKRLDHFLETD